MKTVVLVIDLAEHGTLRLSREIVDIPDTPVKFKKFLELTLGHYRIADVLNMPHIPTDTLLTEHFRLHIRNETTLQWGVSVSLATAVETVNENREKTVIAWYKLRMI